MDASGCRRGGYRVPPCGGCAAVHSARGGRRRGAGRARGAAAAVIAAGHHVDSLVVRASQVGHASVCASVGRSYADSLFGVRVRVVVCRTSSVYKYR
ncbi:hypothetical protein EVAR_52831_1 [Eumeta japonica]|uniref:Uncharacterized protein n=1 Tax=Eumeta variegata TaxID=151549 RepID=A0A4C1YG39_EUMVA|nr:hypothetical protein EVAR_52831_1 [Eumeta japonica]